MSDHSTTAHHHPPARLYAGVLAALLFLTVVTVAASRVDFGTSSINVVIALGIATCKASLVILYFMHLRYDKPMNSLILLTGVLFLGVLLAFCLIDIDSRFAMRPSNLKVPIAAGAAAAGAGAAAGTAPAAGAPAAGTPAPAAAPAGGTQPAAAPAQSH